MHIDVLSVAEVDRHLEMVRSSAAFVQRWLADNKDQPLDQLKRMKFDLVGRHPIDNRPLNIIEQINQTWTYVVALLAARKLLELHPDAKGYRLAPGAHASLPLDILSNVDGLVGAETFAAVNPRNNKKLTTDLMKLAARSETHRYIFFMSPKFPGTRHIPDLDRFDVRVWSVDFDQAAQL